MLQPKIVQLEILEPYLLKLKYETGEIRVFDVLPYMTGDWFSQLRDKGYFRTVRILPDGTGIEWESGQDIAPHELYDLSFPLCDEIGIYNS